MAWRNLVKNKAHTFINITSLSVGMAVAMLIGLWIWDELSYDTYFQNHKKIVQVWQNQTYNGDIQTSIGMPIPLGVALDKDYHSDFKHIVLSSWTNEHILAFGDKKITQSGNYMQAGAPDMLTLKMLRGSRNGLKDPSSVLLSARVAKALFVNDSPMDKTIKLDNNYLLKVTGVYEDLPHNTTFKDMALVLPWDLYVNTQPWLQKAATNWGNNSFQIFAQLNDNADLDKVNARIKDIVKQSNIEQGAKDNPYQPVIFLRPMSKWHLYSEFKNGVNTGGAIEFVWMFGIIGVFVLLLACINFMNLSTARSEKRAKEVGIRKTVGSMRSQLIGQFFTESILVAVFAFALSVVIVQLILPWFNQVADKTVNLLWVNPMFWVVGIGFSLLTGIIAGSYPAFYLSSFKPVKVLKGTFKAGRFSALPRKVLVVLQFTVSITLIIGTVVVFRQVQFTKNRPIGYDRNGLIHIEVKNDDIHKSFDPIRNELLQTGAIAEMAESGSPLTDIFSSGGGFKWRGKAPDFQDDFATIRISPEFGITAGWKIIEGRDLSRANLADSTAIILNEAAVKFMNFKQPLGEIVERGKKYHVIGVIKDMVMASPYEPVKPTIFYMLDRVGSVIDIRLNPKMSAHESLGKIEAVLKKYTPGSPFDYKFTDEEYARKFANEERIGTLAGFFTILAIFISCMGLFGMASFMAEQRTKEIGVSKVLGASVFSLWRLMSTDFVILVSVSLVIAIPTAYNFMHGWLQDYKYRTELSWWIFAFTAVGAIGITVLTVSYQSIKAALTNPVKSLKTE